MGFPGFFPKKKRCPVTASPAKTAGVSALPSPEVTRRSRKGSDVLGDVFGDVYLQKTGFCMFF